MADRHRSSEEIRADIERTRADMDETVQQIGYRLSPGQIVDQVWDRVRTGDAAHSVLDVVRDHPIPSMLMGLGLSWLVYERTAETEGEKLRRKFGDVGAGTYAPAEGRAGPYRGDEVDLRADDSDVGMTDRARSALSSARDTAASAAERVSHAAAEARSTTADVASQAKARVSGAVDSAREGLRHTGERVSERASDLSHRARDTAGRAYEEQPLALGAVAFGLGLASGLAVPSTGMEDHAMGERADRVKEEARRTGSELYDGAKRVASEAQHAARDAISREGVVDELKSKARMVAQEAKTAAREAIEREGVADTLRNRVRTIAQDTRDAAMQAAEREGIDPEGLKARARESSERIRE